MKKHRKRKSETAEIQPLFAEEDELFRMEGGKWTMTVEEDDSFSRHRPKSKAPVSTPSLQMTQTGQTDGCGEVEEDIEPPQKRQERKPFGPPIRDKDGKPLCFGHYIFGRQCICTDAWPCQYYTSMNKASRSRERHWAGYATVPLIDGMDWECPPECAGTQYDDGGDDDRHRNRVNSVRLEDGTEVEPSDVNIKLMTACLALGIEKPHSAKALLLKLDPDVKSLQDMADIIGITKQGLQRRIATELGVGKRQFKENFLLSLSPREIQIFKLYFKDKRSARKTAKMLGVSYQYVFKIIKKLKKRGVFLDNKEEGGRTGV